jgi:hypothetical protein
VPLFRRRRQEEGDGPAVPAWASFMDPAEHRAFLGHVEAALHGLEWRWGDGAVEVLLEDGPVELGLANVAQMSHAAEPADREGLVREHFTRLVRLHEAPSSEDQPYEVVAPLLKIRVWAREDLPPDFPLVSRPVGEDLLAVLSIDWPEQVTTVHADQAEAWGRPAGELWERAAEQTRADPDMDVERHAPDEGLPVTTCTGDSFFASSRALWPDELLGATPPPGGVLVAFPNRHLAVVCAVEDLGVVPTISWLASFVHDRWVEGPGSISRDLHWWRDGAWEHQRVEVEDGTVRFTPGDGFLEVLNGLDEERGAP